MSEQATQTIPTVATIAARIPTVAGRVQPNRGQVAEVTAFIAREFRPERIVLFGSRAYGKPHAESDVDLMVIMDTPLTSSQQAWAIRDAIRHRPWSSMDVHVRTPEQIEIGLAEGDFFIEDVMLQGVTLYVREGMGRSEAAENGKRRRATKGPGLKRATLNWLRRADEDARATQLLFDVPSPLLNLVCYHAQQCAEKYLKALLQEQGIQFPRTHELPKLAEQAGSVLPDLAEHKTELTDLTKCVNARYPELDVNKDQAERAMRTMATVREMVRVALGLLPYANQ